MTIPGVGPVVALTYRATVSTCPPGSANPSQSERWAFGLDLRQISIG